MYYRIKCPHDAEDLDQNEMVEAAFRLPDLEDGLPLLTEVNFV